MSKEAHDTGVELGDLVRISRKPARWTWEVNGRPLELSARQIMNQKKFHKACFERLSIWPEEISHRAWQALVNERLSTMRTVREDKK